MLPVEGRGEGKKKTDLTGKTPQLLAAFGVRGFAACCVYDTCGAHVDPGFQHVYAAPAGEIMRPRRRRRRRTGSGRLAHVRAPLPTANRGCSPPPSSPFVLPSPYISALPCHTSPATTTALDDEQCDGTGGDAVYHGGGGGELSVPASLPAAAQWWGLCCRHPEEVPLPSRFQRRLGEGLAGLNESFLSYSCQGDRRSGRSSCLRSFGFDCKCCFVSLTRKFGCFGC
ncbi:hypothetical protein BHE74_00025783 [Ensete ventricosum]|nr:hypothetical protein BHE74_00025783 [Ensete ventricosum]